MVKQVYINLPVSDLERSTAFYEKLGFTKNPTYSDENASGMEWSDTIIVMLLTHDFYGKFLGGKTIADTSSTNAAIFALSLETKDDVRTFAETAKANGGSYYNINMEISEDLMFGYEVLDPDGHQWEALWMSDQVEQQAA